MSHLSDAEGHHSTFLEQVSLNVNPQTASPLFSQIPPEIRNEILIQSLLPYDNIDKPTPFDSFGYRPEHAFAHRCAVELLQTCKLIFLEARLIAPANKIFTCFSCTEERAPRGRAGGPRYGAMTAEQKARIRTVQIYAQQYALEELGWANRISGSDTLIRPRRLIITVRHHDWWWWESDNGLEMDENWAYGKNWRQGFKSFPALQEFAMELETLERRKSEMDELVKKIRAWKIPLGKGRVLYSEGLPLTTWTWDGTTQGQGAVSPPPGTTSIPYYVVRIEWRVKDGPEGVDNGEDEASDCSDSSPSSYITDDDDENDNALGTEEEWNPENEDETGGEDEDNESDHL